MRDFVDPDSLRPSEPSADPWPLPHGIAPPGYRLPAATGVGRVLLQVADLRTSVEYYQEVVGLRLLDRAADRAALGVPGGPRPLIELRERRGARPVPRHGHLGLYHVALLLPDRPSLGRFLAHLRSLEIGCGTTDHFVSEAVYLADPDGLGIELYADRPRRDWRVRGRELVMTTDPLDVNGLLAAAGGVAWQGAPAGTTVGHVHLNVGNLAEAADFYHRGLGFDQTVWSYPGALFFAAGSYHHHVATNVWARGADPAGEADARLLEWEIVVPAAADAAAALASVAARGAPVEPTADGGVARDPWGNRLRVVSRPSAAAPSAAPGAG
jgi:catechol 2,3-dioxygenase